MSPGDCGAPSVYRMRWAAGSPRRGRRSSASRAGLAVGDLITQAAGQQIGRADDLFQALEAAADGVIRLVILRGADERTVEAQLGAAE